MRRILPFLALFLIASAPVAHAATVTILNLDPAGVGFNDPTAVAPVGGNPGTTLGAQRLYLVQYAADIWGTLLPSNVTIQVGATFEALSCTATSAVLASAGATSVFRDFSGAPVAAHWYPSALANKLFNADLDAANFDIRARFNINIGNVGCLTGSGWYMGTDGNEGSLVEMLPVALHELGHGLGFQTFTSGTSGSFLAGFPSIYDLHLHDALTGRNWDDPLESTANRVASAISCGALSWDGPQVTARAPDFLTEPTSLLRVTAPGGIAGDYAVGTAAFGPALSSGDVTGQVVLVNDAVGTTSDGCEAITNNVVGKIAFIDRGTCSFVIKVKNAQDAGAIGVIIADNVSGCPPAGLGGTDPTITIPSVRISLEDGNVIRAQLGSGVTATLTSDAARLAGTDGAGRVMVYSPNPFLSGSSVSHWDTSAQPNLLMEPAINADLSSTVDLTQHLFADIGWYEGLLDVPATALRTRLEPVMPNPTAGGAMIAWSLARPEHVDLRVFDLLGREVVRLAAGPMSEGRHALRWDGLDAQGRRVAPGVYRYRLRTPSFSASRSIVVVH
jgi:PA domain/FlgD Ig-like domain